MECGRYHDECVALDAKGGRLFIANLSNNSLDVVDLKAGKLVKQIPDQQKIQGVAYVPDIDRIFVGNGKDGVGNVFDGKSYKLLRSIKLEDADNVRYDSSSGRIIVGYGNGALSFVDPKAHNIIGSVKLVGHPESFQVEKSRPRIYVNVPSADHIAVVDRSKQTVITTWFMDQFRSNFPMALDEPHHRVLVGTRNPAKLVVFDTESGKQITALNISGDTDDVFLDPENKRVYVSAGDGYVDVFSQTDADHYQPIAKIGTAPGARTSFYVPELHRLFVAVPHRGAQEPAILIYDVMK